MPENKKRILIVDDSRQVLGKIGALLETAGYEVVKVEHSPQAIKILKKSQEPGEKPFDAVLSDYDLNFYKEARDLIEDDFNILARQMRNNNITRIPIVVMSSEDRTNELQDWMRPDVGIPVLGFIPKPETEKMQQAFAERFTRLINGTQHQSAVQKNRGEEGQGAVLH